MLDWNDITVNLIVIYTYFTLYNLALAALFAVIFTAHLTPTSSMLTLSATNSQPFISYSLAVILFSFAGVPPFVGFFTKVLILTTLIGLDFLIFFLLFFSLLFFSLYFYIQNIRIVLNMGRKIGKNVGTNSTNSNILNIYIVITTLLILTLGGVYLDEIISIVSWWLL